MSNESDGLCPPAPRFALSGVGERGRGGERGCVTQQQQLYRSVWGGRGGEGGEAVQHCSAAAATAGRRSLAADAAGDITIFRAKEFIFLITNNQTYSLRG